VWQAIKGYLAGVLAGLRNIYKSKTFWSLIAVLIIDRLKHYGVIPDVAATDALEVVGLFLAAIFRAGATQDLKAPR
jgi:hypothetical protein